MSGPAASVPRRKLSDRVADLVVRRPRTVLALGLALTAATSAGMVRLTISNDLRGALRSSSPVLQVMNEIERLFGSAETIVIAVRKPGVSAFDPAVLGDIVRVTRKLKRTVGVFRVDSLATAESMERSASGGLDIRRFLDRAPAGPDEAARIEALVMADDDIRRAFIAADGGGHAMYVDPKVSVDDRTTIDAISATLAAELPGYEVYLGGLPYLRVQSNNVILSDLTLLMPATAFVLVAVLWFALRTVSGVAVTLLTVAASVVPAAGAMGFFGIPISAETATFPVLILATSCGDAIHLLTSFYWRLRQGDDRPNAVRNVVRHLAMPVLLTSLTTAAGFLSLLSTPIPPIAGLGVAVALGVMWAWGLSTFVLPSLLCLLPAPTHLSERETSAGIHGLLARLTTGRPLHAAIASAVTMGAIVAIAVIGWPKVYRDNSAENVFPENHPARIASAAIDRDFHSGAPLDILVHADVHDPAVVRRLAALAAALGKMPEVGSVDSIAHVLERILTTITGAPGIPEDPEQLAQALLLYSVSGSPDRYQRLVATDGRAMRMMVRLPNMGANELDATLAKIRSIVAQQMPDTEVGYTGKALVVSELSSRMVQSTVRSLSVSSVLVFVLCASVFRSLMYGVLAMVPLAVAVAFNFGWMGLAGIPLTISTALISGIVIGVGVDFGVHVISRRWETIGRGDARDEIRALVVDVGPPILFNALAVGAGLSVLALSEFEPIRQLGYLAVMSMFASAMGALVYIPSAFVFANARQPRQAALEQA